MTDSSGSIVWQGDFLPFGEEYSITGTITDNLRFPGQYYDEETGLSQNGKRDYWPDGGRYIERDPIGLSGGLNLYIYANANPLQYIDVNGETVQKCCGMTSEFPLPSVMTGLECMSKCLKCTIYISSGWRTNTQNDEAGGASESYHLSGLAADVHEPPSQSMLRSAASECGFAVLAKTYPNRIHVDLREGRTSKEEPNECECKKIREGN